MPRRIISQQEFDEDVKNGVDLFATLEEAQKFYDDRDRMLEPWRKLWGQGEHAISDEEILTRIAWMS
jgi:hypothetical protein